MGPFSVADLCAELVDLLASLEQFDTLRVMTLVGKGFRQRAQAVLFRRFSWVHSTFVEERGGMGLPAATTVERFAERSNGILNSENLRRHLRSVEFYTEVTYSYDTGEFRDLYDMDLLRATLQLWTARVPNLSLRTFVQHGIVVSSELHAALAMQPDLLELRVHNDTACRKPCVELGRSEVHVKTLDPSRKHKLQILELFQPREELGTEDDIVAHLFGESSEYRAQYKKGISC